MNTIILFIGGMMLGIVLGLVLCWSDGRRLRKKNRELRTAIQKGDGPPKPETMKRVVWVCLGMGIAWVWCSYILAYLDKSQIAETLSQVAVTEIIGVVLAYAIKSAIENLSKNNSWPDRPGQSETPPVDKGGIG